MTSSPEPGDDALDPRAASSTSDPARPAAGLRERRRREVRAELERAAVQLASVHGYQAVTTEQMAAAAGVSHRTLFRHVASKDELLLGSLLRGGRAIVRDLERRPPSEPVDLAVQRAVLARIASFEAGEDVEAWRIAMSGAPELLARLTLVSREDRDRLVELVEARAAIGTGSAELLVRLILSAAEHAFEVWLGSAERARSLMVETGHAFRLMREWRWAADRNPEP